MPARAARFTQTDVTRALRGALAAGVKVGRVEITPTGGIVITAEGCKADATPFDAWKAKDNARVS